MNNKPKQEKQKYSVVVSRNNYLVVPYRYFTDRDKARDYYTDCLVRYTDCEVHFNIL